jgi:glyoxylase-like metal-dependent hydrolase (beta-lactamase superfamily II)
MLNVGISQNKVAMENTYYIYNEDNVLIVDPGSDTLKIFSALAEIEKKPVAILLTHAHYDHIMSVEALRHTFEIPVYVSAEEADWLYTPEKNLSGLPHHDDMDDVVVEKAEFNYTNYEEYTLGGMTFKVVPTPGHSFGSVSLIFDGFVCSGDALFKGTIGRTDLPTGDEATLLNSIRTELFTLPDNTSVLPGHGDMTTIGSEKLYNPFFN